MILFHIHSSTTNALYDMCDKNKQSIGEPDDIYKLVHRDGLNNPPDIALVVSDNSSQRLRDICKELSIKLVELTYNDKINVVVDSSSIVDFNYAPTGVKFRPPSNKGTRLLQRHNVDMGIVVHDLHSKGLSFQLAGTSKLQHPHFVGVVNSPDEIMNFWTSGDTIVDIVGQHLYDLANSGYKCYTMQVEDDFIPYTVMDEQEIGFAPLEKDYSRLAQHIGILS